MEGHGWVEREQGKGPFMGLVKEIQWQMLQMLPDMWDNEERDDSINGGRIREPEGVSVSHCPRLDFRFDLRDGLTSSFRKSQLQLYYFQVTIT